MRPLALPDNMITMQRNEAKQRGSAVGEKRRGTRHSPVRKD
jgi:hypothetical protein